MLTWEIKTSLSTFLNEQDGSLELHTNSPWLSNQQQGSDQRKGDSTPSSRIPYGPSTSLQQPNQQSINVTHIKNIRLHLVSSLV